MTWPETLKILIVDDEVLIANLLEDMLTDLGYGLAGSAYDLNEALLLARSAEIDCAILDMDLNGTSILPVAQVLSGRNIPFAFASGHASLDGDFQHVPLLQKPFETNDVAAVIDRILPDLDLGARLSRR